MWINWIISKTHHSIGKILYLLSANMNILKDWKAKLESAYSFMLNFSKITVCISMKENPKHSKHLGTHISDV